MRTIARFHDEHQAHILRINLENAGIPATVENVFIAGLPISHTPIAGLPGVQVRVAPEDVERAHAFLNTKAAIPHPNDKTCPSCGSHEVSRGLHKRYQQLPDFLLVIALLLFVGPIPLFKRQYTCTPCEHEWKQWSV
jgi:hypothetical protein